MTGLVIPMKRLDEAKTRLREAVPEEERKKLCLSMLKHLLSQACLCPEFDRIYIISPQEEIMDWLPGFEQVKHICSCRDRGLNSAAEEAAGVLFRDGLHTMVFLHGDLPYVTAQDLKCLYREAQKAQVVLVPDQTGTGTTALAATPPGCLRTSFGPGSFQKHKITCEKQGLSYRIYENPRLGMDMDLPQDWEKFCHKGGQDKK